MLGAVPTIYVAGPVLRRDPFRSSPNELRDLYDLLERIAKRDGVKLVLPTFDKHLDKQGPAEFAKAIRKGVQEADGLIAMIDAPGAHKGTNLSVAGEAQWAADDGKPVVIVAKTPDDVPRLLRSLSRFPVQPLDAVDYEDLLRKLVHESEEPNSPIRG